MTNLYRLLLDKPGLLGPKIQVLFFGLSLAKEEVMWYFRHIKFFPKKKNPEEDYDNKISEFIYLFKKIEELLQQHRSSNKSIDRYILTFDSYSNILFRIYENNRCS